MATSFFLWPSTAQHKGEDGGDASVEDNPPRVPEALAVGKAKVRKGGARGKSAGPKGPPQRGLGIFQLEQLRLQERFSKTPDLDPAAHDVAPLQFQQLPPVGGGPAVYGAPVAYSVEQHLDCHLHRFRPMLHGPVAFAGAGAGSAVRSVVGDQYALDSYRRALAAAAVAAAASEARYRVGSPFPEPPSNQISQCLSDQCEFCDRKKRLFGDNLSANLTNGADYFEMDLAAAMAVNMDCGCHPIKPKPKTVIEKDQEAIKEFEFFPPRSSLSASSGGGLWEMADRAVGTDHASSSASSSSISAAFSSTPLDLSLKLSLA